ncbi:hypothetical protein [Neorhodopirellula lusitana]|nr:hypothetical protein [Neorhodopirellula lusitana]
MTIPQMAPKAVQPIEESWDSNPLDDYFKPVSVSPNAGVNSPGASQVHYASHAYKPEAPRPHVRISNPLELPAIFMLVLCGLYVLLLLGVLVHDISLYLAGEELLPDNKVAQRMSPEGVLMFRSFFYVIQFTLQGLTIAGCVCALKRVNRVSVVTGFVVSLIPCLGSAFGIFGIPFGIWGLIQVGNTSFKSR